MVHGAHGGGCFMLLVLLLVILLLRVLRMGANPNRPAPQYTGITLARSGLV